MGRFSPAEGTRIETAAELEVRSADAENDVAIAAANIGSSARWLSKRPDSALGRKASGRSDKMGSNQPLPRVRPE